MADAKTVDILMVAALQDELDAVLHPAVSWKTHQDRHGQPYFTRDVPQTHGRALSIAAACSGMGETATTARVTALTAHLNPALIVMCGICAGKRGSVRLGDIIVAERVYSYDHGKLIQYFTDNGLDTEFFRDIKTYNLAPSLQSEIEVAAKSWANSEIPPRPLELQKDWVLSALLEAEHNRGAPPITHADRKTCCPDWKPIIQSLREHAFVNVNDGALCLTATGRKRAGDFLLLHPDGFPQIEPSSVHFGAIATGKTVRQDEMLFDHLERLIRKTIGVDMEAAAIGVVAESTHRPWVVVKAVSDHADSEKDDRYRQFACRASAQFALKILEKHGPEWVRQARHEEPKYEDDASRQASAHLNLLEKRRQEARAEGQSTTDIDKQIVEFKRVMRRGGLLHPGDILNSRYQLLNKLGEGGFATVWKAFDLEQTATVALKALHPHLASERQRIDRFRRGAREMAALEHDAIVRVLHERGDDENHHYFTMELIAGGDLHRGILDKRVSTERALLLLLEVADALAYAHNRGVIHRDIKPSNILIDNANNPKLTDFDLVAAAHTTGGTRTGVLGTAIYAAPELTEQPQHADIRADIYGLGMTAIFVLHGKELSSAILRHFDRFVDALHCTEPVRSVLNRAVEHDPSDRFSSMFEFRNALSLALSTPATTVSLAIAPAGAPPIWKRNAIVRSDGFILELRDRPDDFAMPSQVDGSKIAQSFGGAWAGANVLTETARDLYLLAVAEGYRDVAALAVAIDRLSPATPGLPEGTVFVVMRRPGGLTGWDIWIDARDAFFQTYGEKIRHVIENESNFPINVVSFDSTTLTSRTRQLLGIFSRSKRELSKNSEFMDPAVRVGERVDSGLLAITSWLKSDDRCSLLLGPFGSGKTWLISAFCILQSEPWPIFVPIRQTNDGTDEERAILAAAGAEDVPANRSALHLLLRHGLLVICADGLDERPLEQTETLEARLERWIKLAGGRARVLISARAHYRTLEKFAEERGINRLHIGPLDDERMRSILVRTIGEPDASRTWKRMQTDSTYLALTRRPALLFEAVYGVDVMEAFHAYMYKWLENTSSGARATFGSDARSQVAAALATTLYDTGYASCSWSELRPEMSMRLEPLLGGLSGDEALAEIADGALLVGDCDSRYRFAHDTAQWYFLANRLASTLQTRFVETLAIRPLSPEVIHLLAKDRVAIEHAARTLLRGLTEDNPAVTADGVADAKANALRILYEFGRLGDGLQNAVPERADLRGVRLMGESLAGVRLVSAQLQGADLSGVDLTGADLTEADLSGARLLAARLDNAVLQDASLRDADLTFVAADGCDLTGADLTNAVLRQSVWTKGKFDRTNFTGADVTACVLTGKTDISGQTVGPQWLEVTLGSLSSAWIVQLAWEPSGARLALGDNGGSIFVVEPTTFALLARLQGHERTLHEVFGGIRALAWAPTGDCIASIGFDTSVRLWNVGLAAETHVLVKPHGPMDTAHLITDNRPLSAAWHPNGAQIAIGSSEGVRILASTTGYELVRLENKRERFDWEPAWFPQQIAWNSLGDRLLVASGGATWSLDIRSGKPVAKTSAPDGFANPTVVIPIAEQNGGKLALGDQQGKIWLVKIEGEEKPQYVVSLQAHDNWVSSLAIAGQRLASGGRDSTATLWEPTTGRQLAKVGGHRGTVFGVALDPRGERLVSADGWHNVRSWDSRHRRAGARYNRAVTAASSVSWSPNGKRIAVSYDDGSICVWDTDSGRLIARTDAHDEFVVAIAWDPSGTRIASASRDGTAKIWESEKLEELVRLDHGEFMRDVVGIAWDPSGHRIATCTQVGPIVWDVATRRAKPLASDQQRSEPIFIVPRLECHSVSWDQTSRRIACGMLGGFIAIWDLEASKEMTRFNGHGSYAGCFGAEGVAWHQDGKRIVSCGADGKVRIWDVETAQELHCCEGHTSYVSSVAWSPDGQRVASASWDDTTRIWNAETGEEIACLSGHHGEVRAVDWDPSGRRLATASQDGTLRIWDATTYQLLCTFEAAGPRSLARTPGGYCLFEDRGGEGPPFRLAARRPERPGSALYLPLAALRDVLHRPDKVEAALRGDLSGDGELEMDLARHGLGGGVQWDGKRQLVEK